MTVAMKKVVTGSSPGLAKGFGSAGDLEGGGVTTL